MVNVRPWIAKAVLASQLLAAVCGMRVAAFHCDACCPAGNMPSSPRPCNCCQLNTAGLPSLAASAPYRVAPARRTARPLDQIVPACLPLGVRVLPRAVAGPSDPSPPPIYLLHSVFLI